MYEDSRFTVWNSACVVISALCKVLNLGASVIQISTQGLCNLNCELLVWILSQSSPPCPLPLSWETKELLICKETFHFTRDGCYGEEEIRIIGKVQKHIGYIIFPRTSWTMFQNGTKWNLRQHWCTKSWPDHPSVIYIVWTCPATDEKYPCHMTNSLQIPMFCPAVAV